MLSGQGPPGWRSQGPGGSPGHRPFCRDGRWPAIGGPSQPVHPKSPAPRLRADLGQAQGLGVPTFLPGCSGGADRQPGLTLPSSPRPHGWWPQPVPPGILLSPRLPLSLGGPSGPGKGPLPSWTVSRAQQVGALGA